jgi:DNA-binding SARP family transcriptional activator
VGPSLDRSATLRAAEKFLRLGKLPAAIVEYSRLVHADAADSEAAAALAGLHLRAGETDAAIHHFTAAADVLRGQDDLSRASELYARVLAIDASNEYALAQAADLAARAGDTAGAARHVEQLADCQIARGDRGAAAETLSGLLALDPSNQ